MELNFKENNIERNIQEQTSSLARGILIEVLLEDEDVLIAEWFWSISVVMSILSHLLASIVVENIHVDFLRSHESLILCVKFRVIATGLWLLDEEDASAFQVVDALSHGFFKLIAFQVFQSIVGENEMDLVRRECNLSERSNTSVISSPNNISFCV